MLINSKDDALQIGNCCSPYVAITFLKAHIGLKKKTKKNLKVTFSHKMSPLGLRSLFDFAAHQILTSWTSLVISYQV